MTLHQMPKIGYRAKDAAEYLGISVTKFHALVKDGRIPPARKIDGCAIWRADELYQAFTDLLGAKGNPSKLDQQLGLG